MIDFELHINEMKRDDAIFDFFLRFSRFEYALKRSGFLIKNNKDAKADWNSFAGELPKDFWKIAEVTGKKYNYIISEPPRKQIIKKKCLDFEDKGADITDNKSLFIAVRCIRNNLFHGGKWPKETMKEFDPKRTEKLINTCINILNDVLAECRESKKGNLNSLYYEFSNIG